ncbi:hypothetical protein HMPREF1862_00124 [Varibaculum cambriense]|uniref:Uncharacterized protein n=1 Tax=Varibaculum cambriense TaxID=184870 RepID=A0AB34X1V3_9ACTO|nr:hypothetical protein HMPREF1862_00124 [Varibaculum cambriense]
MLTQDFLNQARRNQLPFKPSRGSVWRTNQQLESSKQFFSPFLDSLSVEEEL